MKYSLISQDWIADCVEIIHEAYISNEHIHDPSQCVAMVTSDELLTILLQDAIIALGGCDKTGKTVVDAVH